MLIGIINRKLKTDINATCITCKETGHACGRWYRVVNVFMCVYICMRW